MLRVWFLRGPCWVSNWLVVRGSIGCLQNSMLQFPLLARLCLDCLMIPRYLVGIFFAAGGFRISFVFFLAGGLGFVFGVSSSGVLLFLFDF